MIGFLFTIFSVVLITMCSITQPPRAACPRGTHVGTLRPSGVFTCEVTPARNVCDTKSGCHDNEPSPRFHAFIVCTGGSTPIQIGDGITVGCQRGITTP